MTNAFQWRGLARGAIALLAAAAVTSCGDDSADILEPGAGGSMFAKPVTPYVSGVTVSKGTSPSATSTPSDSPVTPVTNLPFQSRSSAQPSLGSTYPFNPFPCFSFVNEYKLAYAPKPGLRPVSRSAMEMTLRLPGGNIRISPVSGS